MESLLVDCNPQELMEYRRWLTVNGEGRAVQGCVLVEMAATRGREGLQGYISRSFNSVLGDP